MERAVDVYGVIIAANPFPGNIEKSGNEKEEKSQPKRGAPLTARSLVGAIAGVEVEPDASADGGNRTVDHCNDFHDNPPLQI
jgi:hypothetical protein